MCVFDGAGFHGKLGVAAQVAVVAVDGDEELGPHEVDEQAELFLAAVSADVNKAVRAVVVDDVGLAALRWSMTRKMLFSLPGMMRELRMTVSPASMWACLWLSTAARLRALIGSPCVPLMRSRSCSGG